MNKFKKILASALIIAAVLFCMKHPYAKAQATASQKCTNRATTARLTEAEPFSVINLLTLKFM